MTWVLFCFCGALIISVTIFLSRSPGRFGFHDPTWHFPLAHGAAGSPYRSPGTTSPAGRALNQHCQRQTHTDRCAAQGAWASVHPEGVSPLDRRETLAGQGRTPPRPPPPPPPGLRWKSGPFVRGSQKWDFAAMKSSSQVLLKAPWSLLGEAQTSVADVGGSPESFAAAPGVDWWPAEVFSGRVFTGPCLGGEGGPDKLCLSLPCRSNKPGPILVFLFSFIFF